jgi:hypothetical protein
VIKSEENPDKVEPTLEVLNTFDLKYPDAQEIIWSINKNYYVADFKMQSSPMNAWFTAMGDWALSSKERAFNQLQLKITDAFLNSKYSGWGIEKVNLLERRDMGVIYVICVTDNQEYFNLYYSEYGDLVKIVSRARNHEETPVILPMKVNHIVDSLFGDPEIIDLWEGALSKNVAVLDDKLYRFVAFTSDYEWIGTYWNIHEHEIPEGIFDRFNSYIKSSSYDTCRIEGYRVLQQVNKHLYLLYFTSEGGKRHIAFFEEHGKLNSIVSY